MHLPSTELNNLALRISPLPELLVSRPGLGDQQLPWPASILHEELGEPQLTMGPVPQAPLSPCQLPELVYSANPTTRVSGFPNRS